MTWLFKQLIREQLGEMNIDTKNDILYQTPKQVEPEIVVENIGDPSSSFIYVYGDGIGGVEYIDSLGNDRRVAEAARASFGKAVYETELRDKDKRLIRRLKSDGHTSPFEQIELVVKIVAPIFVARHFLRHRTFSVNEISRRFTSENMQFYYPTEFYTQAEKNLQCSTNVVVPNSKELVEIGTESTRQSIECYNKLIDNGVSREDARMFLPQNLYTSWWMKGNGHNWISMLYKRSHSGAQHQTRQIADGIKQIFINRFPFIGELAFPNDE